MDDPASNTKATSPPPPTLMLSVLKNCPSACFVINEFFAIFGSVGDGGLLPGWALPSKTISNQLRAKAGGANGPCASK